MEMREVRISSIRSGETPGPVGGGWADISSVHRNRTASRRPPREPRRRPEVPPDVGRSSLLRVSGSPREHGSRLVALAHAIQPRHLPLMVTLCRESHRRRATCTVAALWCCRCRPPKSGSESPASGRWEARLATAMTGGITLATWMGGIARELNVLQQASDLRDAIGDGDDPGGRDAQPPLPYPAPPTSTRESVPAPKCRCWIERRSATGDRPFAWLGRAASASTARSTPQGLTVCLLRRAARDRLAPIRSRVASVPRDGFSP